MKKVYKIKLCLFILLSIFSINTFSQSCSVTIITDSCAGNTLRAKFTGADKLDTLKWNSIGVTVNTRIRSINTFTDAGILVAGGSGSGNANNQLSYPEGIFIDHTGNLFVCDAQNNRVQKFALGTSIGTTVAGGNGSGNAANQLSSPAAIFVNAAGNIYIADKGNARIQLYTPGAVSGTTVAGGNGAGSASNQLNNPSSLVLDDTGNLYISDKTNNRIQKWSVGAATGITIAGGNGPGSGANQLWAPEGIYFVKATNSIYITDAANARIQKWVIGAATGTTIAGGHGMGINYNQLQIPKSVAVDAQGYVYVADGAAIIKWLSEAAYGVTAAGGNSAGSLLNQFGGGGTNLNFDDSGYLYVSDLYNHRVVKFAPSKKINTTQISFSSETTYTVAAISHTGCTSTSAPVSMQLPANPVTKINGPATVTPGQTGVVFSANSAYSTLYTWTVPAGCTIVSGQGTGTLTVNWGANSGKITVTASNRCGTAKTKKKTVSVNNLSGRISSNALTKSFDIVNVYPNPAKNIVTINFSSDVAGACIVHVTNMQGKLMQQQKGIAVRGENKQVLNVSGLVEGAYFISILQNNKVQHIRLFNKL